MAALILFSCSDEKVEFIDNPPQLEITVVDAQQTFVSDAIVQLYETEENWKAKSNSVTEKRTGNDGIALFSGLEEKKYYFYVEKAELNNIKSLSVIRDSLKINVKATIQTVIK